MSSPPTHPLTTHNILLTIPRTASNLLTRLLNLPRQPSILRHAKDGYFFLPALKSRHQNNLFAQISGKEMSEVKRKGVNNALQESFHAWECWVSEAEGKNKGTFIKEHANWMIGVEEEIGHLYGQDKTVEDASITTPRRNPTCIPDNFFLDTLRPTLLIRHPALTFPSLLRTAIDNEGVEEVCSASSAKIMEWECTFRWHVMVYRFFEASAKQDAKLSHTRGVTYPIVLEASDLGDVELVRKYAEAVGLDPGVVVFEWDDAVNEGEKEGISAMEARMKDTLLGSRGVVVDKLQGAGVADVDVEGNKGKWRGEFGDRLAERLERLVEGAMGDYGWLWERRLRA
ncbi:hypothetical protein T440DRAFT_458278 [Plenodomus tracheiphilus IPT5]|uniref:P-loop containing nucleoside triphosphate hydrolase protein n=1 Tax=Plenodomus tracheiphilus IPT5 TaxID=1408161 RepID=A0A6A7AWQ3_9PLEO|nr:hypothetical protein T440DRAFT_458278 [Plenodomus tracheiphilus IPT5]